MTLGEIRIFANSIIENNFKKDINIKICFQKIKSLSIFIYLFFSKI